MAVLAPHARNFSLFRTRQARLSPSSKALCATGENFGLCQAPQASSSAAGKLLDVLAAIHFGLLSSAAGKLVPVLQSQREKETFIPDCGCGEGSLSKQEVHTIE